MLSISNFIADRLSLTLTGQVDSNTNIAKYIESQSQSLETLKNIAFGTGHILKRDKTNLSVFDKINLIENLQISQTLGLDNFEYVKQFNSNPVKEIISKWVELIKDGNELKPKDFIKTEPIGNSGSTINIEKVTNNINYQIAKIKTLLEYEDIELVTDMNYNFNLFEKIKVTGIDADYRFVIFGIRYNFKDFKITLKGLGVVIYK